jgi:hypothetical protein
MHIIPHTIKEVISLEDAFIAIYILTAVAAAETMVIVNLAEWAGGVRKLFKLAASASKEQINDASDKKPNPRCFPYD